MFRRGLTLYAVQCQSVKNRELARAFTHLLASASVLLVNWLGVIASCSSWSTCCQQDIEGICAYNATSYDSVSIEYLALNSSQVGVFLTWLSNIFIGDQQHLLLKVLKYMMYHWLRRVSSDTTSLSISVFKNKLTLLSARFCEISSQVLQKYRVRFPTF